MKSGFAPPVPALREVGVGRKAEHPLEQVAEDGLGERLLVLGAGGGGEVGGDIVRAPQLAEAAGHRVEHGAQVPEGFVDVHLAHCAAFSRSRGVPRPASCLGSRS